MQDITDRAQSSAICSGDHAGHLVSNPWHEIWVAKIMCLFSSVKCLREKNNNKMLPLMSVVIPYSRVVVELITKAHGSFATPCPNCIRELCRGSLRLDSVWGLPELASKQLPLFCHPAKREKIVSFEVPFRDRELEQRVCHEKSSCKLVNFHILALF